MNLGRVDVELADEPKLARRSRGRGRRDGRQGDAEGLDHGELAVRCGELSCVCLTLVRV